MTTHLHEWMEHPELLNKETLFELRTLLARYPYFQAARILYLKNLYILHDTSFGEELHKSALFITDKRALFYFIEGERYTVQPHSKEKEEETVDKPGEDRTLSLIDNFLADRTGGNSDDEETIPSLSTDYLTYSLREEDLPEKEEESEESAPMRGQDLIDDFIEKADEGHSFRITLNESTDTEEEAPAEETEEPKSETNEENILATEETEPVSKEEAEDKPEVTEKQPESPSTKASNEDEDESYFTETLAKIYIKQKRYEKALEIIKKLSLKYPKKNSYFADQIRFLEKLIINSKSK